MRKLLSTYGDAIRAVQLWEYALKGLAVYFDLPRDDEEAGFDETWETVERTLTTAAGPLRRRLEEQGYGPQDLHDELKIFRDHRNELAHQFFLDYARVLGTGDPEAHGAALKFLEGMEYLFQEQAAYSLRQ